MFQRLAYVRRMAELPFPDWLHHEHPVPVDRDHLLATIAIALRSGTRHERQFSAEAAAKLIAEKVVDVIASHPNYVIVCREPRPSAGTTAGPPKPPEA